MFLTPCIIFILLSEYSAMNSKESIVHSLVLAGVSKAWQAPVQQGTGTEGEGGLIHCTCKKLLWAQSMSFVASYKTGRTGSSYRYSTVLGETVMDFFS